MMREESGEGPLRRLDRILIDEAGAVEDLLRFHRDQVQPLIYTSADVRRNQTKAAVVDANAFPAGFNNLSARSREEAVQAIQEAIDLHRPGAKSVVIVAENHTRNKWYFQNLKTLQELFSAAGVKAALGSMNDEVNSDSIVQTALGDEIRLQRIFRTNNELVVGDEVPDMVVLNNDLSAGVPSLLEGISQPVTPPAEIGWHARSKSRHFGIVANLVGQMADEIGFDPWLISAHFACADNVDFKAKSGMDQVARTIDDVLGKVQDKYDEYEVEGEPTAFIKADSGTYGMGITTATSGEQFLRLNSKGRARMDKGKELQKNTQVIIQEGVSTSIRHGDQGAAEPVLYMLHGRVVGGFYRIHETKGPQENLNSPGSKFQAFLTHGGKPGADEAVLDSVTSHVYQILGDIASVATSYEIEAGRNPDFKLPAPF